MIGRRLYRFETGLFTQTLTEFVSVDEIRIGDYWQELDKIWYFQTPAGLANLSKHNVIENKDKTITVTPSILVTGKNQWHGYLEKGHWRHA